MNTAYIRRLMWSGAVVIVLAAAAQIALAIYLPLAANGNRKVLSPSHAGNAKTSTKLPSWSAFEPVVSMDLRRPLFDGQVQQAAPPPPLTIKLAGTILEPGNNLGMFTKPDGQVEMKGVGEKSGDAEILEIQEDSATVLYHGRQIQLKVEKGN